MNINEISPVSGSQPIKRVSSKKKISNEQKVSDKVEISSKGKNLQNLEAIKRKAQAVLKNTPEVREEKINEVKKRVQSGYYNSPQVINNIADRLIDHLQ